MFGLTYSCSLYLQDLAANKFWNEAVLPPLPWHQTAGQPAIGAPEFRIHKTILDSIAPSMPLKATFAGVRR